MLNLATHWPLQFGPYSVTGGSYTQAGSGDPTPENIRAITPWKAAGASTTVTRTGKNLLPYPYTHTTKTLNGITWTVNADGSVTVNGTASADSDFVFSSALAIIPGSYVMSGCPAGGSGSTYFMYGANLVSAADIGDGSAATVTVASLVYTAFARVKSGTTISNKIFWPQIEKGSTKTAYEPYISKSATLASPELYAGYMGDDWYWRRTWTGLTLTGNEGFAFSAAQTNVARFDVNILTGGAETNANRVVCSHFNPIYNDGTDIEHCRNSISGSIAFIVYINKSRLSGWDDGWSTAQKNTAFNTWLAGQVTAGTPVTVAYQLATPVLIAPTIP
jgi:hypothetical protein